VTTFREQLKGRFAALGFVVLVVLGVLLARLWSMQVLNGPEYVALAEDNRVREIPLEAPRGRILDRDGNPLVDNRATLAVCVAPTAKDDEELLYSLSTLVELPVEEIRERLESTREEALTPRVITLDASPETVAYLSEHESEFPGVEIQARAVREYPFGTQAAHVLGYTGEVSEEQLEEEEFQDYVLGDVVGKAGAERQFESVLQGTKGFRRFEVDASGDPRRIIEEGEPIPGSDVMLTIDSEVQAVAEQALINAMKDAHKDDYDNARAGAAVALDVKTGEVLAMASAPTYDPTLFLGGISHDDWQALNDEDSEYPLTNRTMMALYPPASTFKAFTGLAGLEHGVTRQWTQYYCPGKWTEMGEQWPKWCWLRTGHRNIHFHDGVVESCDTVFYEIGYEFYKQGDEKLQSFSREFGFGELTGIDLPGELPGRVPDAEWKADFNEDYPEYRKWLPGDTVNMAIGQGDLLVSPLQLATAYSGIANDGQLVRPHVLREVHDAKGEPVHAAEPEVSYEPPVSDANLAVMDSALRDVTTEGTAETAFRGFDVEVAGKTGTAEVATKDDYAWFVAYAPADDPQYSVAVVIEQGGHGGAIAAPAGREILSALFGLPVEHVTGEDESR
jgi:penicillin-binding protein 2